MRANRTLILWAAVTASSVPCTWAQAPRAGQAELGVYGILNRYDREAGDLESRGGAGGSLGVFLSRRLSLEAVGELARPKEQLNGSTVSVTRIGGRLLFGLTTAPASMLYLGAGYERIFYRGGLEDEDNGVTAVLGDRISLGGRAALRLEGRVTVVPQSRLHPTEQSALFLGGAVGISIFGFGGPPRDTDLDGIPDKADRCAATPRDHVAGADGCSTDPDRDGVFEGPDQCPQTPEGALVDALGCPSDSDGDQYLDGLDICPDTPAGASVDANGCPSDTDRDGVLDGLDSCADTPFEVRVDSRGCPTDRDGDGVFDGLDLCADTPPGIQVTPEGCPADDDADGVPNSIDRCEGTPAGSEVDPNGCRIVRDQDSDGIEDQVDRCPDSLPGEPVDAVGCSVLFEVEEGVARPLVLEGVSFASGEAELARESYATLDRVAASLAAHPDVRVEIAGHTDGVGGRSRNLALSLERARSVRGYLVEKGIDPDRLVARGYGPDQPIASNRTREGRARNRRVELHRIEE